MKKQLFTIGFTQKTAEKFFEILIDNNIEVVLDIRLNNTSQLSVFSKYPDIEYFLKVICNMEYRHDIKFAPDENTLKKYKKKEIDWIGYVDEFNKTMSNRNIIDYLSENYSDIANKNYCLLCSEAKENMCHRKILSNILANHFKGLTITHL